MLQLDYCGRGKVTIDRRELLQIEIESPSRIFGFKVEQLPKDHVFYGATSFGRKTLGRQLVVAKPLLYRVDEMSVGQVAF